MDGLNILFGVISVLSFLFAIYTFVRNEIAKAAEQANVEIMKERIESLYNGLVSLYHSTDAIVQIPKSQETNVNELQNLGRVTRGQVYVLLKAIEHERKRLKEWKYGTMPMSEQEDGPPVEELNTKIRGRVEDH